MPKARFNKEETEEKKSTRYYKSIIKHTCFSQPRRKRRRRRKKNENIHIHLSKMFTVAQVREFTYFFLPKWTFKWFSNLTTGKHAPEISTFPQRRRTRKKKKKKVLIFYFNPQKNATKICRMKSFCRCCSREEKYECLKALNREFFFPFLTEHFSG